VIDGWSHHARVFRRRLLAPGPCRGSTDATGAHRLPILDADWVVLSQTPKAGSKVPAGSFIKANVKKFSDD
jgi:hypothetical protein